MTKTIVISLLIFISGCGTTSKIEKKNAYLNKYKDVYLLSLLVRDHLRNSDSRKFDLNDLKKIDSLNRISSNFEKIEFELRPAYISVDYKFSEHRNLNFELYDYELNEIAGVGWKSTDTDNLFDGKIKFDYGEDHYRIKKILINEN